MKKLFITVAMLIFCIGAMKISLYKTYSEAYNEIENFARERGISMSEYPQDILEMLDKNSETEEFVKNWPVYKWTYKDIQNLGITDFSAPPLLMQWDMRWGTECTAARRRHSAAAARCVLPWRPYTPWRTTA